MSCILWLILLVIPITIDGQLFNLFGLTVTTNKILGDKLTSELKSTLAPTEHISPMVSTSEYDRAKSSSYDTRQEPFNHGRYLAYQGQHFGTICPFTPNAYEGDFNMQPFPSSPFISSASVDSSNDSLLGDLIPGSIAHARVYPNSVLSSYDDIDFTLQRVINQMIQLIITDMRRKWQFSVKSSFTFTFFPLTSSSLPLLSIIRAIEHCSCNYHMNSMSSLTTECNSPLKHCQAVFISIDTL